MKRLTVICHRRKISAAEAACRRRHPAYLAQVRTLQARGAISPTEADKRIIEAVRRWDR